MDRIGGVLEERTWEKKKEKKTLNVLLLFSVLQYLFSPAFRGPLPPSTYKNPHMHYVIGVPAASAVGVP